MDQPKKKALISVYHKDGIEEFAQELIDLGFEIYSSGGTAKYLSERQIPVTDVQALTGFPPILGHRVVTLHPKIHGGILAKNTPEHNQELAQYGIPRFDLVCVDLYPVQEAIKKKDATVESVMELTDIGGPTLLRTAAKNHENCIVVSHPGDRNLVIALLKSEEDVPLKYRKMLASEVFFQCFGYDAFIRAFFEKNINDCHVDNFYLVPEKELAYAENRYQNPAHLLYNGFDEDHDPLAMHKFKIVSGTPSYISIADGSAVMNMICHLAETFKSYFQRAPFIAATGKHANPCGLAIDWDDPMAALLKALKGDPIAVMGGELVTNFEITDRMSDELLNPSMDIGRKEWMMDIILAPEFSEHAQKELGDRKKRRLMANPALAHPSFPLDEWAYRPVRGGFLRQKPPYFILNPEMIHSWANTILPIADHGSLADLESMLIAMAACWHGSSNSVTLAKDKMLIGRGFGQQDRIACVELCLRYAERAGHDTRGSMFASDAFFPFAKRMNEQAPLEGPELLIAAGCKGGIVPYDGIHRKEVKNLFTEKGLSVAFLKKEYRGFAKH